MTEQKTLVLVDGSSYLYRAYHAMPDLRAVPGDPTSAATGAIRGMINMLQSLRREVHADYAACIFDAPGPTFRDDLYPQYKAQRAPMRAAAITALLVSPPNPRVNSGRSGARWLNSISGSPSATRS